MGYGLEYRPWDELIPDTLGQIFRRLPLDEILNVVPRVCKSWANAVRGPYCWQEIDIEDWSRYRRSESLDRMLLLLISRSHGSLRKLCVYGLSTHSGLDLIAENAKSLQNLRLPRSEISDPMVEQVARRLSGLTFLDLSYCTKIGAQALEAVGRNCKFLTHLQRNMHPWDVIDRTSQDDEAFAIAAFMPKLRHLELAYLMITIEGVVRIVTNCRELELLDMRGCWNVKREAKFFENFPRLKVVGPLVVDSCSGKGNGKHEQLYYYPGPSDFLDWSSEDVEFDVFEYEEGDSSDLDIDIDDGEALGLVFYNNLDVANVGDVWPESP